MWILAVVPWDNPPTCAFAQVKSGRVPVFTCEKWHKCQYSHVKSGISAMFHRDNLRKSAKMRKWKAALVPVFTCEKWQWCHVSSWQLAHMRKWKAALVPVFTCEKWQWCQYSACAYAQVKSGTSASIHMWKVTAVASIYTWQVDTSVLIYIWNVAPVPIFRLLAVLAGYVLRL